MLSGALPEGGFLSRIVPSARKTAEQCEADVSQFVQEYRDRDCGVIWYLARRPVRALAAVADVARLPRLSMTVNPTVDGYEIVRALLDRRLARRLLAQASVLVLPDRPGQYALGHSRQTLRRKVRKAEARGITWRKVDDGAERRMLAQLAYQVNADEQGRLSDPKVGELLRHPLWLAAFSEDRRPLLLSVTPFDGEWALLRCFKPIGTGTDQSLARYYLVQVLVEHLVSAGVRYLFDDRSPLNLANGLRHYQRMIGCRIYRLKIARPTRRWAVAVVRGSADTYAPTLEEAGSAIRPVLQSIEAPACNPGLRDGPSRNRRGADQQTASARPAG